MDLDARGVVEHLQILKNCLTDLLQVLQMHRRETAAISITEHFFSSGKKEDIRLSNLSGVLVFYPGADVRMQCEVWSEVFKIFCRKQTDRWSDHYYSSGKQ